MVEAAEQVKRNCERLVMLKGRKLECEVWRQEGSGNHRSVAACSLLELHILTLIKDLT